MLSLQCRHPSGDDSSVVLFRCRMSHLFLLIVFRCRMQVASALPLLGFRVSVNDSMAGLTSTDFKVP